jgi:hypothetical protein
MMRLPYYIIVNAGLDRYLLFTRRYVNTSVILTAIENPQKITGDTNLMGDGAILESGLVNHDRDSENGFKVYTTKGALLNRWIETPVGKIYEYSLEQPCLTLPVNFYNVYTGKDHTRAWHLILRVKVEKPEKPALKIPPHVLKGFVNSLIASKETCPVTMEPLCLGGIAITGCYHAFERGVISHIMGTSRVCPSCRAGLAEIILM